MLLKDVGRRKVLSLLALKVPHAVDDARDDLRAIIPMKKVGQQSTGFPLRLTRFGSLHKVSRTVEVKRQRQRQRQVFGCSARVVRGSSPRATIERWADNQAAVGVAGPFLQSLIDFDHLKSIVRFVQRHAQRMAKVKWRRELGELNLLNRFGSQP